MGNTKKTDVISHVRIDFVHDERGLFIHTDVGVEKLHITLGGVHFDKGAVETALVRALMHAVNDHFGFKPGKGAKDGTKDHARPVEPELRVTVPVGTKIYGGRVPPNGGNGVDPERGGTTPDHLSATERGGA